MALGKNRGSEFGRRNSTALNVSAIDTIGKELDSNYSTRMIGRKRVIVSNHLGVSPPGSSFKTPIRRRSTKPISKRSLLESLPQELLVRILCGVNHDDLKQLFHVSKSIREATLIAKKWHFAFNTPSKKIAVARALDGSEGTSEFDTLEAPNAPRQLRSYRSPLDCKKLSEITVALFV